MCLHLDFLSINSRQGLPSLSATLCVYEVERALEVSFVGRARVHLWVIVAPAPPGRALFSAAVRL